MGYYRARRNPIKEQSGKETAKRVSGTKTCDNCGEQAVPYERHNDRVVYLCNHCGRQKTYAASPIDIANGDEPSSATKQKKVKRQGPIVFRDRSGENKKKNNKQEVDVAGSPEEVLKAIRSSMNDKKMLAIEYTDAKGNESVRLVEPYKLAIYKGKPILYAFCTESNSVRMFKIKSISSCSVEDFEYKPRWDIIDQLKTPE